MKSHNSALPPIVIPSDVVQDLDNLPDNVKAWTELEDEVIFQYYMTKGPKALARVFREHRDALGSPVVRTCNAIRGRASRLGLVGQQ